MWDARVKKQRWCNVSNELKHCGAFCMKHSTSLAHEVNISQDDDDYVVRENENENESRKSSKVISVEWVANAAESNLCCSCVSFFCDHTRVTTMGGKKWHDKRLDA